MGRQEEKRIRRYSYEKIRNELERLEERLDQLKYNKSSQKTVAEQIFKEFLLLICSLMVTTIFSIMSVIGDVVSAQANNFTSTTSIDLTFDLIMEYVSGTLSVSNLILQIFLVFMFITSIFHILLSVFDSKKMKKILEK